MDNKELENIAKADQLDRVDTWRKDFDELRLWKRDAIRLARVTELVNLNVLQTSNDYINAAIVFQHGRNQQNERDSVASGMAIKMMQKALELDPTRNKWLLAAAIDRDLMIKGQPQIYGTQYTRETPRHLWEFYTLDPTQISDEERKTFNVATLAEQLHKLILMNKTKLKQLCEEMSLDKIVELCLNEDVNDSTYDISQLGVNSLAYQFYRLGQYEKALKIFELNTQLYPKEYDTYHGLGDCLVQLGRTEKAIEAFEKSLELNPEFGEAKRDLAQLLSL